MWQRFTERARRVVFFAQEEAARFGENSVGTEHLLLGLMREPDSVAGRVLYHLGIEPGRVRSETERRIEPRQTDLAADMQLTPRGKRVIDLAYEEARQLNNNYIGTEHLLLGLMREADGLAALVLCGLGATLERVRDQVRSMQEAESGSRSDLSELGAEPWLREKLEHSIPAAPLFTERAAAAARLALQIAGLEGAKAASLRHLLLGLISDPESGAGRVLQGLKDVPLDEVRDWLYRNPTGVPRPWWNMPLSRALDAAVQRRPAPEEGAWQRIGTPHLLLAALQESGVLTDEEARLLRALGSLGLTSRSGTESDRRSGARVHAGC